MEIVVDVPQPPGILHPNQRSHNWRAQAAAVKKQRQAAGYCAIAACKERPQWKWVALGLHFCFRGKRKGANWHDPDNLIAWAKSSVDGLQDAELLANDRMVLWLPPKQSFETRENGLVITVKNLDGMKELIIDLDEFRSFYRTRGDNH